MDLEHLCLLVALCLGVQRSSSQILLRHKRNWVIGTFEIDEKYNGAYPYILGKIDVEKALSLFRIHGQGVDKEPLGVLKINEDTGEISVLKPVDHEEFRILKLTFQALDKENHVLDTQLGITIDIKDANDNTPKFSRDMYEIAIKESTLQGKEVVTVTATDLDSTLDNRRISYRLVSSTPQSQDLQFYLNQKAEIGAISFKGCLDHEKAEKYTLLVEAKDHGKPSLSSTCTVIINIEDGNNHLPVITGQTGPGRVTEGQENVLVSRFQVKDEDVKGTEAWRAKYHIQGDTQKNFRITTDPETNDGLLYLEKQLSYEEDPVKNITITVENEIPYYSCKVEKRTTTGLWKTKIITSSSPEKTLQFSSYQVSVIVEDVNEPPLFGVSKKHVSVRENIEVGTYLETFTASDPDINGANIVKYVKGRDPAGWIAVDPETGKITTAEIIDRESSFVKDGVYVVTIHAVDNGEPPLTGTTTLSIMVTDENDNTPSLVVGKVDMCQSDEPSLANITALDLDEEPYGGPFRFKLLGNVEDEWRVDPQQGYSVNLVKEIKVHSGIYELLLEVSDLQGEKAVHNLSVTVCNCFIATRPDCKLQKPAGSTLGGGAIGIIILSLIVLAGFLLLALLLSCSRPKPRIPEDCCTQHLMPGNTEQLGTDCKVPLQRQENCNNEEQITIKNKSVMNTPVFISGGDISTDTRSWLQTTTQQIQYEMKESQRNSFSRGDSQRYSQCSTFQRKNIKGNEFVHGNDAATATNDHWKISHQDFSSSDMKMRHQDWMVTGSDHSHILSKWSKSQRRSMRGRNIANGNCTAMDSLEQSQLFQEDLLQNVIQTMMTSLKAQDKELTDYDPHVYADEGNSDHNFELDAISNPEVSFDPDLDFDTRFSTLASICMPDDLQYRNSRQQQ